MFDRKNAMIEARKALVVLAIEKTLLEVGRPTYDEVLAKLHEDYIIVTCLIAMKTQNICLEC